MLLKNTNIPPLYFNNNKNNNIREILPDKEGLLCIMKVCTVLNSHLVK